LQSHDSPSFIFSLDLLPQEIFGTEEVPVYILSDSSRTRPEIFRRRHAKTEDQPSIVPSASRTRPAGHHRPLQCRTRTSHGLEALVGGKILILTWFPCLSFWSHAQREFVSLLQTFLTGTTTWRPPRTAWWKLQITAIPEASMLPSRWS
jgi:hypothetical protein